jgi:TPR repeat protein
MIRLPTLSLLTLLLVAVAPAGAQDIDKGKEAVWRGDYATALAELRPLAAQGNVEAQYSLANLYRDGRGVPRDDEKAAALYQRAAEGGSWWAALDLGLLYWAQVRGTAESDQTSDDALVRVHMWLGIAAATEEVGCVEIGAPLRNAVAQSMTPEQIAQAEERSRVWIAEHVEKDVNVVSAKPAC